MEGRTEGRKEGRTEGRKEGALGNYEGRGTKTRKKEREGRGGRKE
jgi:hypothetical protein